MVMGLDISWLWARVRSKVDRVCWARNTPSELPLFCFPVPPTTNFSPHICKEELTKQTGETDIWLVPFTYVQNFQKVENEEKRNFAINPSKLVRNLFCKKPSTFAFLTSLSFQRFLNKSFLSSWSYCLSSAPISELMLYFMLLALSIPSDPYQGLNMFEKLDKNFGQ